MKTKEQRHQPAPDPFNCCVNCDHVELARTNRAILKCKLSGKFCDTEVKNCLNYSLNLSF